MTGFSFRLQTLLKLREAERRQRQSALAEGLAAGELLGKQRHQLLREQEQLRDETRRKVGPGTVQVDAVLEVSRYELVLRSRLAVLDLQQQRLAEEIERRRDALVEADRQVKILEKLRERQMAEHTRRVELAEVAALDEAAQHAHLTTRLRTSSSPARTAKDKPWAE